MRPTTPTSLSTSTMLALNLSAKTWLCCIRCAIEDREVMNIDITSLQNKSVKSVLDKIRLRVRLYGCRAMKIYKIWCCWRTSLPQCVRAY